MSSPAPRHLAEKGNRRYLVVGRWFFFTTLALSFGSAASGQTQSPDWTRRGETAKSDSHQTDRSQRPNRSSATPQVVRNRQIPAEPAQPANRTVREAALRGDSQSQRYEALAERAERIESHTRLVRDIVDVCQPAVVHIDVEKIISNQGANPVRVEEAGAGLIFRHRAHTFVLTNRHLVNEARKQKIRIQLADGRFFRPTEIRMDRDTDLAVLYTRQPNLISAKLGDSDGAAIGDHVVAIGSPFGLNHSVSTGIISAKGRRDLDLGSSGVRLQDFMQTDASINPGNSGGPLFNLRGEVIGINTAIASNSGHNEGIGFTIPINMAMRVATDLIDYGAVRRGYLGVSLDSGFSPEKAEQIGLNTVFGARVTSITPGSPASQSDIRVGDVILRYDGQVIENDSHLVNEVSLTRDGQQVAIELFRRGRRIATDVIIRVREN